MITQTSKEVAALLGFNKIGKCWDDLARLQGSISNTGSGTVTTDNWGALTCVGQVSILFNRLHRLFHTHFTGTVWEVSLEEQRISLPPSKKDIRREYNRRRFFLSLERLVFAREQTDECRLQLHQQQDDRRLCGLLPSIPQFN